MTATDRRLQAEWDLLQKLAYLNPTRLAAISSEDHTFRFTLQDTPARLACSHDGPLITNHDVRVVYPSFFPSTPMELYVGQAFLHPNVHPITGFVCIWARHRIENTIEDALHILIAMMNGYLYNLEALHTMQPDVLPLMQSNSIECKQLFGTKHKDHFSAEGMYRRRRLS